MSYRFNGTLVGEVFCGGSPFSLSFKATVTEGPDETVTVTSPDGLLSGGATDTSIDASRDVPHDPVTGCHLTVQLSAVMPPAGDPGLATTIVGPSAATSGFSATYTRSMRCTIGQCTSTWSGTLRPR